mgnify:CR=1 FL=1|jgi:hypothetical protein|tara:strand:+ start:152 stop:304 length:153 start_codon:yes stop_codon:yes gene_type:complete
MMVAKGQPASSMFVCVSGRAVGGGGGGGGGGILCILPGSYFGEECLLTII